MNGNSLFRRCFRCRRRRRILKSLISWERGPEKLLMYALEYSSLGTYSICQQFYLNNIILNSFMKA